MNPSSGAVRAGGWLVSMGIHAIVIYALIGIALDPVQRQIERSETVIHIAFTPPPPSTETTVVKPEQPKAEPAPRREIKPVPEPVIAATPDQVVESVAMPSEPAPTVEQDAQPEASPLPVRDTAPSRGAAGERDLYLAQILASIEKKKSYPETARRRRIQGMVKVAFLILPDGEVSEIVMGEGPAALVEAARRAVLDSFPLPPPPAEANPPIRIQFVMKFVLE